ncbi:hypothetical protein GSI_14416 [Ganoderma sinense ZZ0214-1]|uniref:Uncharacterized protein n=1 Tax=Ganoderma sinense ZZ0214-1 TaxID=1077348 RepID=A0A2G8RNM9_9APHY|nr:hypothetical protein GSI_14416 [Ganoderma sinense ZZ0214-1]
MATLTRTRPTFQAAEESSDAEHHRPLHLDIPTPFPNVRRLEGSSSSNTPQDVATTPSMGEMEVGQAAGSAAAVEGSRAEATETETDMASASEELATNMGECSPRCGYLLPSMLVRNDLSPG